MVTVTLVRAVAMVVLAVRPEKGGVAATVEQVDLQDLFRIGKFPELASQYTPQMDVMVMVARVAPAVRAIKAEGGMVVLVVMAIRAAVGVPVARARMAVMAVMVVTAGRMRIVRTQNTILKPMIPIQAWAAKGARGIKARKTMVHLESPVSANPMITHVHE